MGKKIGKYELGKTLGTGNFSKVKLGTDTETGDNWAIKIVDKEQLAKEHEEEELKREIAVMKLLKHENVVQLREVMQTANHIYLVLELVTGGELFDKTANAKKFDEVTARKYFHELIMGIHYCHSQGIAHGDIKPEKLLLGATGVLKISDFSKPDYEDVLWLRTQEGFYTVPTNVAPEVLKKTDSYDRFCADVWSCGVVLFVMLAGYLPFDDPNTNALLNKIERGEYRMPRHFSADLKDLISRMLTADPAKRITLEQVIAHPWFQVGFDRTMLTTRGERAASTHPVAAAGPPETERGPISEADAFDLISRLTSGALNPLTSEQQSTVKSSTRFLLYGDMKDVTMALESLKGNPKSKEGTQEIKGFVNGAKGLLTYLCIVIPTCANSLALVEFRRGRGDVFEFHEFFRQVVVSLGTKIRSKDMKPPDDM